MVSVDNITVNQAPGVGMGSTQWRDWLPNGITETKTQRQCLSEHDTTIMTAWDRGVTRQVTGHVTEKLGRVGFLTGP